MCLFKRDEQENTCNHEECKRANNITLPNLQDPEVLNLIKKKVKTEVNMADAENGATTISKNTELQNACDNIKSSQEQNTQANNIGFQNCAVNNENKKDLLNNVLINGIISQNTPNSKLENPNSNNHLFMPFIQNTNQTQQPNNSHQNNGLLSNQNLSQHLAVAQYLTQNIKMKPINMITPTPNTHPINNILQNNFDGANSSFNITNKNKHQHQIQQTLPSNNNNGQSQSQLVDNMNLMNSLQQCSNTPFDTLTREFQNRILNLLVTQNKMLIDLKEKNEILQDTLACLINEINTLRSIVKNTNPIINDKIINSNTSSANTLFYHQIIGNSTDTITTENLLTYLYGNNQDFNYQLVLKSELSLPLYRERNFKFTVLLTDKNGNTIENTNRISLTIGIYSSENPPKYIDANTSGNKILKGFIEKDLVNGQATFEKIQIKEVTSHFRNGWVFFVVYPKLVSVQSNNNGLINGQNIINSSKIKPLILEKVIVKAKKSKERDLNESTEVYNEDEQKTDEGHGYNNENKEEVVYSN